MQSEPVLMVVLVAMLTEAGGAVSLLASDHTTAGVLVAVGTFLTGVGGAVARSLVSPVRAAEAGRRDCGAGARALLDCGVSGGLVSIR
jgi:hypothetical protein